MAEESPPMDVTNRFVLDFANRFVSDRPGAEILDFGCGAGTLVAAGRTAGLNMLGADVYYGGSQTRAEAERSGLLGSVIREIHEGRTPFEDSSFDLITNNQVLEHVEDLDAVLAEMYRILKSDGVVLSIFPSATCFGKDTSAFRFPIGFPKAADFGSTTCGRCGHSVSAPGRNRRRRAANGPPTNSNGWTATRTTGLGARLAKPSRGASVSRPSSRTTYSIACWTVPAGNPWHRWWRFRERPLSPPRSSAS